jgi:hypothetical protein
MTAMLSRVGWNDLLDFVHRRHSASPDLPLSILPFNVPTAAWRCFSPEHQLTIPARGSVDSRVINTQEIFCFVVIQDG